MSSRVRARWPYLINYLGPVPSGLLVVPVQFKDTISLREYIKRLPDHKSPTRTPWFSSSTGYRWMGRVASSPGDDLLVIRQDLLFKSQHLVGCHNPQHGHQGSLLLRLLRREHPQQKAPEDKGAVCRQYPGNCPGQGHRFSHIQESGSFIPTASTAKRYAETLNGNALYVLRSREELVANVEAYGIEPL